MASVRYESTQPHDLRWVRPPRQARSQETLDRLLDAAERLVADKGFADTSVAEVARRADSSVGAFYARFPDKDALLYALYERYLEQAIATADEALDPVRWEGAGVAEISEAVITFLVAIYRDQGGLIRAFSVRGQSDLEFGARQVQLTRHVHEKLVALLTPRAGEISHPVPQRAIAFGLTQIFATLDSVLLFGEMRWSGQLFSDEELTRELIHTYLAYLGVARN